MTSPALSLMRPLPRGGLVRRVPQYWRVYEDIRRRIEGLDYAVGSFVPTESELCALLGVSRTTVRKAVELLVDDGFLAVRRGRGTEVLDFRAVQKLQRITSFSETLRERGCAVTYRELKVRRVPASPSVADDLQLPAGAPVILVHRLVVADGKPIALMDNYLAPEMVPGLEAKVRRMRTQPLYAFLEAEYGVTLDEATDSITALAATRDEAARLRIPPGTPLIFVRRITSAGGHRVERADLHIVASRYEYSVHTSKRPRGNP
ncbi:MAG TPA: GntR family transcriptional regulator [Anaeromyxobacter sp.]|nr:GntR family transcriptional regulator [Anaeromyxobacter sp.]